MKLEHVLFGGGIVLGTAGLKNRVSVRKMTRMP
jgi:hypothetical protein